MSPAVLLFTCVTGWLAVVLLVRWIGVTWLSRGPRADPLTGLIWRILRGYCRLMHRVSYAGLEHVPDESNPGGLIVVSNHTGPVDPLLIQAACRFEIRWMMATDMMVPQLDWLWRRQNLIPVGRDGRDTVPARQAIRHVRAGGVVGIFPEGAIPRPPGELRPFHEGVGLIVSRTKAPVLLVWVSQTPESAEMFQSLVTPSRARVEFIERIDFAGQRDASAITRRLRQRIAEVSGWPLNSEPLEPTRPNPDPFAV